MVCLGFAVVGGWVALLALVCRWFVVFCGGLRVFCYGGCCFCSRAGLVGLFWLVFGGSLLLLVFLVRFRCFAVWVVYNLLCFVCLCSCVFLRWLAAGLRGFSCFDCVSIVVLFAGVCYCLCLYTRFAGLFW